MKHHRNFPIKFQKFLLRDILRYTNEDIKNLSLIDYEFALHYALDTYARRDVAFVMESIYGEKGDDKGNTSIKIEHPEIEAWIKKQYEKEGEKTE